MTRPIRMQTADIVSSPGGEPQSCPGANVVPFMRPDADAEHAPPIAGCAPDARPAPARVTPFARARGALFLVASLAIHAGALAVFYRPAPPLASVGERSISVEIVLGGDRAAGQAVKPTVAESTVDAVEAEGEGPELVKPETARAEVKLAKVARDASAVRAPTPTEEEQVSPAIPQQRQTAVEATAVEAVAEVKVAEAKPVERQPATEARPVTESTDAAASPAMPLLASTEPSTEAAPLVETPPPEETSTLSVAATNPATAAATAVSDPTAAEAVEVVAALSSAEVALPRARPKPPKPPKASKRPRRRQALVRRQRKDRGRDVRTRESRTSVASTASSGIGRGRSDDMSNYRGLVAAQIARAKRFPPGARRNGEQGRAVVSFTIEGSGRVTRVALVRATGVASLDREARAMVRRAAPFPPPPVQRRMRFNVPVSFSLR